MMMEFMEKKFLALKQIVVDELPYDPVIEHELAFEEFMWAGLERSKLASIICHVSRNRGECIGFTGKLFDRDGKPLKKNLGDGIPREDILKGYQHYFGKTGVFENDELKARKPETSEPQISDESDINVPDVQVLDISKTKNLESQVLSKVTQTDSEFLSLKSSESESSTIQIQENSESKSFKTRL